MASNTQPVSTVGEEALALRTPGGTLMCEFSDETVANIRRMLTSLMYQATMPRSIANVAALRGEGVTYLTLAMATTLASDVKASVCAVELNWWNPGMHIYLAGQQPQGAVVGKPKKAKAGAVEAVAPPASNEGLGAVLRGATSLDKALVGTSIPNLSLLPAGNVPPEARSALARSAQLKETFATLAEQFDYLIIDIPAVAATSDTVALTSLASAATIVVRQGVTPANTVKGALDEVKHIPVLGVILNQVQIYTPRWILNLLPQE